MVVVRSFSQAAHDAVRRGHTRYLRVALHRPAGEVMDLPIEKGELAWSLSRKDGTRSGRLTIPGYEFFEVLDPKHYGWVEVFVGFPNIATWGLGEFPILDVTVTRPGGMVEVTLGDWAYRRAQPDGEVATTLGTAGATLKSVCQQYLNDVMPVTFTVTRDDTNGAVITTPYELRLGGNVWDGLTALCNQAGAYLYVVSREVAWIVKYNPLAAVGDTLDGTVTEERIGWVTSQAVNRVIVQLDSADPGATTQSFRSIKDITTGSYAYSKTGLGKLALVETMRQPAATQAAADAEAQRLFDRRAGILRTQSISTIPTPWLQVGDVISWQPSFMSTPIKGMIDSLTMPLTADGKQRITLRDVEIR